MKKLAFLLLLASSAFAQPFEVLPDVAIKDVTTSIRLRRTPILHDAVSVTVAGKPAAFTFANLSSDIDVTLPDLPAGTVADIAFTLQNGQVLRRTAALRIVGQDVAYSPALFDRILIPVIYNGPGAEGLALGDRPLDDERRQLISPLRTDSGARFWAFVSVTNNETQHVTVISPNP